MGSGFWEEEKHASHSIGRRGLSEVFVCLEILIHLHLSPGKATVILTIWEKGKGAGEMVRDQVGAQGGLPAPGPGAFHLHHPPVISSVLEICLQKRREGAAIHRAPSNCQCFMV